jgi:hypothetical protein
MAWACRERGKPQNPLTKYHRQVQVPPLRRPCSVPALRCGLHLAPSCYARSRKCTIVRGCASQTFLFEFTSGGPWEAELPRATKGLAIQFLGSSVFVTYVLTATRGEAVRYSLRLAVVAH